RRRCPLVAPASPTRRPSDLRALRLAPRPAFLAGREELLADLDTRLTGDDGAGPRTVALSGLGGAGKTSVALEYAHRHLGEVGVVDRKSTRLNSSHEWISYAV